NANGRVADGGVAADVGDVAAHHDLTGHLGVGRVQVVGRAFEELDAGAGRLEVRGIGVPGWPGRAVEVPVDVELAVERVLFEVGQQDRQAADPGGRRGVGRVFGDDRGRADVAGRQPAGREVVVVDGQPDLLEVVHALGPVGGLADLLHGR